MPKGRMGIPGFMDRREAGRLLAEALRGYARRTDVLVLGLPRGGVPVAAEVAVSLDAPLDVFVVRKLGFPGQEELAMGAVASGGIRVLNRDLLRRAGIDDDALETETRRRLEELETREAAYRLGLPAEKTENRTVILVDDGLATGASMRAAIQALRQARPARIVAAVPVASREGLEAVNREADEVICLSAPAGFTAVGEWYADFRQVSDAEVRECLAEAAARKESRHG